MRRQLPFFFFGAGSEEEAAPRPPQRGERFASMPTNATFFVASSVRASSLPLLAPPPLDEREGRCCAMREQAREGESALSRALGRLLPPLSSTGARARRERERERDEWFQFQTLHLFFFRPHLIPPLSPRSPFQKKPRDLFLLTGKKNEKSKAQRSRHRNTPKSEPTLELEMSAEIKARKAEQRARQRKNEKKRKRGGETKTLRTTASSYDKSKLPAPSLIATSSLALAAAAEE